MERQLQVIYPDRHTMTGWERATTNQTYPDRVKKGHHQSDISWQDKKGPSPIILWQGEKGPPPIRHTVTGWERAITNQTYHDKTRKGDHRSDIPWQDEKGRSPIRPLRATVKQRDWVNCYMGFHEYVPTSTELNSIIMSVPLCPQW